MTETKEKSIVDILTDGDYVTFRETAKSKLIEKLVWDYYSVIEEDIKKQLNINKEVQDKNPK